MKSVWDPFEIRLSQSESKALVISDYETETKKTYTLQSSKIIILYTGRLYATQCVSHKTEHTCHVHGECFKLLALYYEPCQTAAILAIALIVSPIRIISMTFVLPITCVDNDLEFDWRSLFRFSFDLLSILFRYPLQTVKTISQKNFTRWNPQPGPNELVLLVSTAGEADPKSSEQSKLTTLSNPGIQFGQSLSTPVLTQKAHQWWITIRKDL